MHSAFACQVGGAGSRLPKCAEKKVYYVGNAGPL